MKPMKYETFREHMNIRMNKKKLNVCEMHYFYGTTTNICSTFFLLFYCTLHSCFVDYTFTLKILKEARVGKH